MIVTVKALIVNADSVNAFATVNKNTPVARLQAVALYSVDFHSSPKKHIIAALAAFD